MFAVKRDKDVVYSLSAKQLSFSNMKHLGSTLAQDIVSLLADKPLYPADIAKALGVNEQKVYYHIRNLEKAGIIELSKKEAKQGATANYYKVSEPAFIVTTKDWQQTQKLVGFGNGSSFLEPFIVNGKLDALIVVGSPDPHGPDKARSRDGYYGIDLALFLGTFLNYVPQFNVKLDTEVQEAELQNNLILIGGPITNKTAAKFNDALPIKFVDGAIKSTISKEEYPQDECGLIVKAKNPFNKEKSILLVAGKRFAGTRAAIIAFLKHFTKVSDGNLHNAKITAHVVEGVDLDSDGIVDDVEFRE